MKKLFLVFALILFTVSVVAQDYGVSYTVAAPTSKTSFYLAKNNTLKVTSTHTEYSILKDIPAGTTVSTAIADLTWLYPVGSATSASSTITTLTATTANITTANVATTLSLPGTSNTIVKTTGNRNSVTLSNSLAVGDTLVAPIVSITYPLITTGVVAGSSNFTATRKVVKIPIAGVTSNDRFFIQSYQTDSTTAVLAADKLSAYPKTDTLIVIRPGSGTSGLKFDWYRVK